MKPDNTPNAGKKEEVKRMFDNIAPTYDRLNHILSLSIDRVWRRRVMRIVRRAHPRQILDLATGTGDLAILMAKRRRRCGGRVWTTMWCCIRAMPSGSIWVTARWMS